MTENSTKGSVRKFVEKYQVSPLTALYELLKDYFFAIVGAAVIALFLRVYVIEAFRIPTDFMAPMLLPGDHIFVNKIAYSNLPVVGGERPSRGDVVVFSFPNDPAKDYIKRVIAVEGDTIELKASQVILNGKVISRPIHGEIFEEEFGGHRYQVKWDGAQAEGRKMVQVRVPPEQVFVLGDNRAKGQDSRAYGFLPFGNIKGRASIIWFSTRSGQGGTSGSAEGGSGVRWSRLLTRVK